MQRITVPTFGDLVLCPEPNYPERYVIARIIGLPGDVLRLKDQMPQLNGEVIPLRAHL